MSNNLFFEHVIKAKPSKDFYIKISICIVATILGMVGFPFLGLWGLLISIVGIGFFCFFMPERKLEYEYAFTNGNVSIAAIYNLSKRKELFSFEMDQVTMVAPTNSQRISNEKYNKKKDYTSRKKDAKAIALMVETDKAKHLVMIEPNEKVIEHIKLFARSKMYGN